MMTPPWKDSTPLASDVPRQANAAASMPTEICAQDWHTRAGSNRLRPVKPKIYSEKSRVGCEPYRANISAASCKARFEKAEEPMTLLKKRRGEHLRQGDILGCKGCKIGESVRSQLVQISLRKQKREEEDVPVGSEPQGQERSDPERNEKAASAAPPRTIAPPKT